MRLADIGTPELFFGVIGVDAAVTAVAIGVETEQETHALLAHLEGKGWQWNAGQAPTKYNPWFGDKIYIALFRRGVLMTGSTAEYPVLDVDFSLPSGSTSGSCSCRTPVIMRSYIGIGSGGEWVEVCRACKRERP